MYLETTIWSMLLGVFGNPIVLGLFALLIFIAMLAVARVGLETAIVIIVPAMLLIVSTIPTLSDLKWLFLIIIGFIVFFAIFRIVKRG